MEATLEVLNDLVARGIIEKYAIGGAVGAIFWVERVSRLLNEAALDRSVVASLIERFGLDDSWTRFVGRYPELT